MGFYWSLAQEIARVRPRASCVVPSDWLYPKTSAWVKESRLNIVSSIDDNPDQIVYADRLPMDGFPPHTMVCLAVSPLVEDVERVRRLRGRLIAQGLARENIVTMLFQAGTPGALPVRVMNEQLGPFVVIFPYDPYSLLRAENERTTLQTIRPHCSASKKIRTLAHTFHELFDKPILDGNTAEKVGSDALEAHVIERIWEVLGRRELLSETKGAQIESLIEDEFNVALAMTNTALPKDVIDSVRQNVSDHVTGLGPLEKIMRDPRVTEIMVNGERDIYVERDGGIFKSDGRFSNRAQLVTVIDRVVASGGRRVDASSPLCDVRLADGSRVNVVLPPVSLNGPLMTIRRFRENMLTMADLERAGTLSAVDARALRDCVQDHKNIVVAGNSGSGKTTLLNILSGYIDSTERIITIEDSAELKLQQPHVVRLETRTKNADGVGALGVSDLVVNALRMRPDRLVIGECRGAEVIPMLQAMNTGHDGSMTTVHANSAKDALHRLESMVLIGAPQWPIDVVRDHVRNAIDVIIYIKRSGPERKLIQIMDVEQK
jgi:pilus assembly protein CpaF